MCPVQDSVLPSIQKGYISYLLKTGVHIHEHTWETSQEINFIHLGSKEMYCIVKEMLNHQYCIFYKILFIS